MKINRFVALAAIALLVVGAMGIISYRAFAQHTTSSATQTQDCSQEQDVEDQSAGPDMDDEELQCGDQNESDDVEGSEANQVDEPETDENPEAAALQDQVNLTAEQAQQVALDANPGATVIQTELDNENGQIVYSVELSTGVDVKVDALSGAILATENAEDD